MRSGAVKEKYVVMTDADDIYPLTMDFAGFTEAFDSYDADIVLASSDMDWPPVFEVGVFEEAMYGSINPHAFHGQSSYMAKTEFIADLLDDIVEPESRFEVKHFDDQAALRMLHMKHYPRIKVDVLRKLFVKNEGCSKTPQSCQTHN